jgi:phosphatidylserine/phosphatidylglycerophosphate/cardiolipin synthase-like enzyme
MRLLAAGITVARTADDLVRYHAKMMIIDRQELFILGFNFTYMDIERSRSFGVFTKNPKFVREAVKLFDADTKRQAYEASVPGFVVSPQNSRAELCAFIQGAKRELLIYDPKIDDAPMVRLLEEKAERGVDIRIIGKLNAHSDRLKVRKLTHMRLHTRTMLRDGRSIFVGSQSLRTAELDARREVGVIFSDPKGAARLQKVFEDDWRPLEESGDKATLEQAVSASKVAKKVAKVITKALPPVGPVVSDVVKGISGDKAASELDVEELEMTVRETVREAVKDIVRGAVQDDGK